MINKKASWWPFVFLLIIVLIFIGLFIFAASYSNPPQTTNLGNNSDNENNDNQKPSLKKACQELGCPEGSIYIGSKNSDKYYECECRWAENIEPKNRICFSSDAEAITDDRTKSEC